MNTIRENVTAIITKMIVNYKTSVRGWELNEESMFDWESPIQHQHNDLFEPYQTQLPISEVNPPEEIQSNKLQYFSSEKIHLTVEIANIGDILALSNDRGMVSNNTTFSFKNKTTKFGTNNCVTHYVCHLLQLFIELKELDNDGVNDITVNAIAAGIGTIRFAIKDFKEKTHIIALHNVIYLPKALKILISIT